MTDAHKYVELFAGAGGLSRGLDAAGFHAVAHAEIEPHARAVLRYRWPETRLDGDVTQINGADYAGITLLSGGSPCQDLSVAGKRAGLTGSRSSLFHEQCRIWRESGAPYLLWENVLGALSSNNGADFATVLSSLVGSTVAVPADGWRGGGGVVAGRDAVAAFRVLDLQYFGPPQRRVRVFILAARAGGVDPAEVLALSEGECGHPSPRRYAAERDSSSLEGGSGVSEISFHHTQTPISGAISPAIGCPPNGMGVMQTPVTTFTDPGMGVVVGTLDCTDGIKWGSNQWVAQGKAMVTSGRPRRLTPLECERLMSWPDQWTATGIDEKGREYTLSDTARYRLCGNGVGSVCAEWIARRLMEAIQ